MTMTITAINKHIARDLGREIEAALSHIAMKHGLDIRYAGGTLDSVSMTMKLKIDVKAELPVGATPSGTPIVAGIPAALAAQCRILNLDPNKPNAKHWTLVDYVPSRWKYPFTVKSPAGARYKISESQAQRYFTAAAPAPVPATTGSSPMPSSRATPTPTPGPVDDRYASRF